MFGRIKYKLLVWLLNDICDRTYFPESCDSCSIYVPGVEDAFCPCSENGVYVQARKVWKVE